ncbi:MAG: hypothetical protein AAF244_04100 [Pseudomonadota bacterium]
MANFSKLDQKDQFLLVSVPYRVGIWISQVDDVESRKMDDKKEEQVLELAIQKMAGAHRKMPFAAAIMKRIDKSKGYWTQWKQQADEKLILEDVEKAIQICETNFKEAEVKQYKQAVWQTGILVAQAYDEGYDPDGEMHVNHFAEWVGSFFAAPKLKKAPENMSQKEKSALKKLRSVLKQ